MNNFCSDKFYFNKSYHNIVNTSLKCFIYSLIYNLLDTTRKTNNKISYCFSLMILFFYRFKVMNFFIAIILERKKYNLIQPDIKLKNAILFTLILFPLKLL